jgi:hypothetical protein
VLGAQQRLTAAESGQFGEREVQKHRSDLLQQQAVLKDILNQKQAASSRSLAQTPRTR